MELGSWEIALIMGAIAEEAADGTGADPEEALMPVLDGALVMIGEEGLLAEVATAPTELMAKALLRGAVALGNVVFAVEEVVGPVPDEPEEPPENSFGPGIW